MGYLIYLFYYTLFNHGFSRTCHIMLQNIIDRNGNYHNNRVFVKRKNFETSLDINLMKKKKKEKKIRFSIIYIIIDSGGKTRNSDWAGYFFSLRSDRYYFIFPSDDLLTVDRLTQRRGKSLAQNNNYYIWVKNIKFILKSYIVDIIWY